MNYQKHYDSLIETRKNREPLKGYVEIHHILPKSMGGSDDKSNLVQLTAREHFLAHWLLWRIHRNSPTAYAFFAMQNFKNTKTQGRSRKKFSSIAYAEAKEAYSAHLSKAMSGIKRPFKKRRPMSEELKKKLSAIKKGKPQGKISSSRSNKLKEYMKKKWAGHRIEKICVVCGNQFSTILANSYTECCSQLCGNRNRRRSIKVTAKHRITEAEKDFKSIREASISLNIHKHVIKTNTDTTYSFIYDRH